MKNNRQDEWLFAAFSAPVEIPDSMQACIDHSCETVRRQNRRGKDEAMRKNIHKTVRTALIAAVMVIILTVSAVAVYQHTVSDAAIDDVTTPAAPGATELPTEPSQRRFSCNGFSDSPEYQAYLEWENWLANWMIQNPNRWVELGVEDTYFETPENYAHFYNANFSDQAEALDAIMAKYGLTLHEKWGMFNDEAELNRLLGVEDIFSDTYEINGEYMYDDGSFKVYCPKAGDTDAVIFFSVNGSFTSITSPIEDCDQWNYTTSSGVETALGVGTDRSYMAAELSGAYIAAVYYEPMTQQELETMVEGIDLQTLDSRFAPGKDTGDITQRVAALAEEQHVDTAAIAAKIAQEEQDALACLGDCRITDVPQGYSWSYFNGSLEAYVGEYEKPTANGVQTWLAEGGSTFGMIELSYFDLSAVSSQPLEQQLSEYVEMQKSMYSLMYADVEWTACKVGDYDAWMQWDGCTTYLQWQDTDSGLLFNISYEKPGFASSTMEEMIAMAESVVKN